MGWGVWVHCSVGLGLSNDIAWFGGVATVGKEILIYASTGGKCLEKLAYLFIYFKEIIVKNENQILEKSIHFNNEFSRRNINSENFTEEFRIPNQIRFSKLPTQKKKIK